MTFLSEMNLFLASETRRPESPWYVGHSFIEEHISPVVQRVAKSKSKYIFLMGVEMSETNRSSLFDFYQH